VAAKWAARVAAMVAEAMEAEAKGVVAVLVACQQGSVEGTRAVGVEALKVVATAEAALVVRVAARAVAATAAVGLVEVLEVDTATVSACSRCHLTTTCLVGSRAVPA
jgi:hypothetical protein